MNQITPTANPGTRSAYHSFSNGKMESMRSMSFAIWCTRPSFHAQSCGDT